MNETQHGWYRRAVPAGAETVWVRWQSLPLIFGIMAFCYSGHSVFPSVQASMSRPQDFPRVLNAAYATVAMLSTFLAAAGYFMFGSGALDVVTFNLPAVTLKTLCAVLARAHLGEFHC
jgi:solute carrier family 32 (vesicular inhibitory amino acid transporter)